MNAEKVRRAGFHGVRIVAIRDSPTIVHPPL
jgi:hypothetical protein